jgi:glycolate oxidase FAD binding subunit
MTAEQLASAIRSARADRRGLRISAHGTWLDGGWPVRPSDTLSLATMQGVIEYVPGDLTITVAAATTLQEIADVTGAAGQWLPLDPAGTDAGSIGATIATASAGALATGFGAPRDMVLGIQAVTGAGAVIRAGGRVVKNVAGFDLVRLFTGSWGSLGVITELTLRLRGRPAVDGTIAVAIGDEAADSVWRAVSGWADAPLAAELLDATTAAAVGAGDTTTLLVRLGGNAAAVAGQLSHVQQSAGSARDVDPAVWTRLRQLATSNASVLTWTARGSNPAPWHSAVRLAASAPGARVHGSPLRGTVRCCIPDAAPASVGPVATAMHRAQTEGARAEQLAAQWRTAWQPPALPPLHDAVRRAYDPDGVLNPGIMGAEP